MGRSCLHNRKRQGDQEAIEGKARLEIYAFGRMAIVERIEALSVHRAGFQYQ